MPWERWRVATERALYGPGGFYHRPEGGPGHHFRTATTASPHFAAAVLELARRIGAEEVVEVGAARGALLTALADLDPALWLAGVEVAERPAYLPERIGWGTEPEQPVRGLLVANEWLDNVPCDVAELVAGGPRYVEVDETGAERLGDPVTGAELDLLERWWPLAGDGDRAEIGLPRDQAWARAVGWVGRGLAVAVDYAHTLAERRETLTGYRDGRQVLPVPDGSCDITAHVALDSCVLPGGVLTTQRDALRALGISGSRPEVALATADPPAYLRALRDAGEQAELIARGGLGDFGWLLQGVGIPVPPLG